MDELEHIFKQWRFRYRLQRCIRWGSIGLVLGLSIGLAVSFIAISQHLLLRHEFFVLTGGFGVLIAGVVASLGYFWKVDRLSTARIFDRLFELQDRISTAFEIHFGELSNSVPWEIIQRQLRDAIEHACKVDFRQRLSLGIKRTRTILIFSLIFATVLAGLLGDEHFQATQSQRLTQQAINQNIENIESLHKQIENDSSLPPTVQQELLKPLIEAEEGLRDAETVEEAVAVLTKAQEIMTSLGDNQELSEALQEAGSAISGQEGSVLKMIGEELSTGDLSSAAQNLSNIDTSQLSQQEQLDLAKQLLGFSEKLAKTSSELSEQIRQVAISLQQGDIHSANQSLEAAAQLLRESGNQITLSEMANQAAEQLGQAKTKVQQAGQPSESMQPSQKAGSSQTQGETANSNGSGSGSGESQELNQGSQAGSLPIDQVSTPGEAGEQSYEKIYTPLRVAGQSDTMVTLPESGGVGEQVIGINNVAPEKNGYSNVPYVAVYQHYAEFYRHAMNSSQIPTALREYVRLYFLSLEP